MDTEHHFYTSYGLSIPFSQVIEELRVFMNAAPSYAYRITIGTDSERLSGGDADFVTAVVVHRVGNGGKYFWRRVGGGTYHTLRDRIIREVLISLESAQALLKALRERYRDESENVVEWGLEVHADVGVNGPTKDMIQEVLGMIRAYNFEPRMKPESYAASSVADRHV